MSMMHTILTNLIKSESTRCAGISRRNFCFEVVQKCMRAGHRVSTRLLYIFFVLSLGILQLSELSENHSPVVISNQTPTVVGISCFQRDTVDGRMKIENALSGHIDPMSSIDFEAQSNDNSANFDDYNQDDFGDKQFCQFQTLIREYNCAQYKVTRELCVWEHPESRLRRARLSQHTDDDCPICETWPQIGPPRCKWIVAKDGMYVLEYNVQRGLMQYNKKGDWLDDFEDPDELVFEHNITIRNNLDSRLTIIAGTHFGFRKMFTLPSRTVAGVVDRTALLSLKRRRDVELLVQWEADFVVAETGDYRFDVELWESPVFSRDNEHLGFVDSAWKVDSRGIWLDVSGCGRTKPKWKRQFDWMHRRGEKRSAMDERVGPGSLEQYEEDSKRPRSGYCDIDDTQSEDPLEL